MTVDEFVELKVHPEHRPVVAAVRSLMKECAPRAEEVISYGMPVYRFNKPFAWISLGKTGISLGFREGKSFEDRYGLLRGAAKHAKNVRMANLDDFNRTALTDYVKQAVALDR